MTAAFRSQGEARDIALYIEVMASDLKLMAEATGMRFLGHLLAMAAEEARSAGNASRAVARAQPSTG